MNLPLEVPFIKDENELKEHLKPIYIIEDYMSSYTKYEIFQDEIYNLVKATFEKKKCREYPIVFKFYRNKNEEYVLQLRHFLINVFLWYPFVELDGLDVLNETFILDCNTQIPRIENFINHIIDVLTDCNVRKTVINHNISRVLYNLRSISINFSIIMNLNFTAETFLQGYQNNPRIRQIMESHFDHTMQPSEIEKQLHELQQEEIEIFMNDPHNPIGVILSAGTGIKHKQLAEFTIAQGLKPDLVGKTITLPITNSTLLRGLENPSDAYIDAGAARKSLVSNHNIMGKAGYFGKIVLLLARTLKLSKTVSDCNTKHLVKYHVSNNKFLKKLNGRYYKLDRNEEEYSLINSERDKELVGKDVYVRSACTCALGDEVCAKCFGLTANLNWDIADGISGFESEEVTKVINQSILSTKHLLTTNSEIIEFNPEFYKFFTLVGGDIMPIVNNNEDVPDIQDWAIFIDRNNMAKLEEFDNESYNTYIVNGEFTVYNLKTKESISIKPTKDKEIFLSDDALDLIKKKKGILRFDDMDDDMKLFSMDIYNNELTRPLYELMDLLNKEKHDTVDETIESMSQKFADLLVESGIDASVVAAELIINRLIRDVKQKYERPDFTKSELPDYQIYTVSRALRNNKSPIIGICFQNIKQQLLDPDTVNLKDGESYLDSFFMEKIPTKGISKMRPENRI